MALGDNRAEGGAAEQGSARPFFQLPPLRVESEYRNETRNLQRQERERYSNYLWNMVRLDMGPQASIASLVGPDHDIDLNYNDEPALNASLNYYHRKSDTSELLQVLKFFTAYLMQQARKEPDPDKQQFLLFKAADLARMIVQYSPMAVNEDAEALVFGIYVALGTGRREQFGKYMTREQSIYDLMRRLEVMSHDLQVRLKLAGELEAQTSYFDALVQYRMLVRILAHRGDSGHRNRCWVWSKIGDVFQTISELTASRLRDARKVKSFIDRFNRDFAEKGRELPRLQAPKVNQVTRLRHALMQEANRWYLRAAPAPLLDRRMRANLYTKAGRNLNLLGRHREALRVLREGYPNWARVPESKRTLSEQASYLKEFGTAAINLKNRRSMDWTARESSEVHNKLRMIEMKERDRERAREELQA